jgi:hypothetical protein
MVVKVRLWLKLRSRKESFFSIKTNPAGCEVRDGVNKMLPCGGKSGTFHIFMDEKQGFPPSVYRMTMVWAFSRTALPVFGGAA